MDTPDSEPRDSVDAHVARWADAAPELALDPDVEGAVSRMGAITKHLSRHRERSLVDHGLHPHEYSTLHALAGRKGRAAPSQLVADLGMSPAAVTGRLDTLERRGLVRRTHSATDRRRVDVELTGEGRRMWVSAISGEGVEEARILAALAPDERLLLSDLLRRVLVAAERGPAERGPAEAPAAKRRPAAGS